MQPPAALSCPPHRSGTKERQHENALRQLLGADFDEQFKGILDKARTTLRSMPACPPACPASGAVRTAAHPSEPQIFTTSRRVASGHTAAGQTQFSGPAGWTERWDCGDANQEDQWLR